MTEDQLTNILCIAIRSSLDELRSARAAEELNGYALCTDDDLSAVYPVASTIEQCSRSDDTDRRYIPVDWEYDEGVEAFDAVNTELARRVALRAHHMQGVRASFDCLVRALEQVRQVAGALPADVLLIVTSTDPSPELESLATEAVRRLNGDELFRGWSSAMSGALQGAGATLQAPGPRDRIEGIVRSPSQPPAAPRCCGDRPARYDGAQVTDIPELRGIR